MAMRVQVEELKKLAENDLSSLGDFSANVSSNCRCVLTRMSAVCD